jgi:hypothetical protein
LRIRPRLHKSSVALLEPVARNAAIRRSNPRNRWILSTNADMIFVPFQSDESLSSIVSEMADGFYLLPRFELPETLWEQSLERTKPQENISFLRSQGKKIHLNMIARRNGFLKYDSPGDFQLMLREDIFRMRGFDERMVDGWHVDSNLNKRMFLLLNKVDSLETRLAAYHCNHTKKKSFLHSQMSTENDWHSFVGKVSDPILNNEDWGLASENIEEIHLNKPRAHVEAISSALSAVEEKNYSMTLDSSFYNHLTYSSARVLSYLADHFYSLPKTCNIAYIGHNTHLLHLLASYLENIGFQGNILTSENFKEFDPKVFIFDFGFDEDSQEGKENYALGRKKMKQLMDLFFVIVKRAKPDAKFIGVNARRSDFNVIFEKHLSIRRTTHVTGITYGYLPNRKDKQFSLKRTVHYLVVKFLFNHTNRILNFLSGKKRFSRFFKR